MIKSAHTLRSMAFYNLPDIFWEGWGGGGGGVCTEAKHSTFFFFLKRLRNIVNERDLIHVKAAMYMLFAFYPDNGKDLYLFLVALKQLFLRDGFCSIDLDYVNFEYFLGCFSKGDLWWFVRCKKYVVKPKVSLTLVINKSSTWWIRASRLHWLCWCFE